MPILVTWSVSGQLCILLCGWPHFLSCILSYWTIQITHQAYLIINVLSLPCAFKPVSSSLCLVIFVHMLYIILLQPYYSVVNCQNRKDGQDSFSRPQTQLLPWITKDLTHGGFLKKLNAYIIRKGSGKTLYPSQLLLFREAVEALQDPVIGPCSMNSATQLSLVFCLAWKPNNSAATAMSKSGTLGE